MRSDLVDLEVVIRRETDGAWGLEDPDHAGKLIWIPKAVSEVEWDDRVRKTATITMPERWAIEKRLI